VSDATYTVTAEVWLWPGKAAWHFLTLPEDVADEIHARFAHGAFGMVPVRATIGQTTWDTKLFGDTKRDSYLLPLKAAVRRRAGVEEGDTVTVRLDLDAT
jgi:hypothetical protein